MAFFLDARIPVRFALPAQVGPEIAWLVQDGLPVPMEGSTARFHLPPAQGAHPVDCLCCQPRGPIVEALSRLFFARVRGEVAFFRSVVAITLNQQSEDAVKAALGSDPFLVARFRVE